MGMRNASSERIAVAMEMPTKTSSFVLASTWAYESLALSFLSGTKCAVRLPINVKPMASPCGG